MGEVELQNLTSVRKAFDLEACEEWHAVASREPRARLVRFHLLYAEKDYHDPSRCRWKARGVALGNNERSVSIRM